MVFVSAGVCVGLVDGGARLLALQEERVPGGASFEEDEVHHHADAADPDHLPDDVHRGEAVEQAATVLLERQSVFTEEPLDDVALLIVVEGDAQRGLRCDACPPTPLDRQLLERAAARPCLLLLLELHLHLAAVGWFEVVDELVEARALVPDVEERQRGVEPHPVAIGVDRRRDRSICLRGFHVVLPRRHHQAGRQAGHVPLEGTGQGLVEVAQIEVEVALRCGPEPEVQDVGVTAELDLDTAVRPGGEVCRHHRGGAAVKVPGRKGHALMPEPRELGEPDVILGQECVHGIVPAGPFVPVTQVSPGRQYPGLPTHLAALGLRSCEVVFGCDGCGNGVDLRLAHGVLPSRSELSFHLCPGRRPFGARQPPVPPYAVPPASVSLPSRRHRRWDLEWIDMNAQGVEPGRARSGHDMAHRPGRGAVSAGHPAPVRERTHAGRGDPQTNLDHPALRSNCGEAEGRRVGPFESTCATPAQRALEPVPIRVCRSRWCASAPVTCGTPGCRRPAPLSTPHRGPRPPRRDSAAPARGAPRRRRSCRMP